MLLALASLAYGRLSDGCHCAIPPKKRKKSNLVVGGCRETDEPHQLHFDVREAALRQGLHNFTLEHPVSPLLSVVFSR